MRLPFFTIGHSNRSLEDFVALLTQAQVASLVDIRKLPGSRAHPRFDGDRLSGTLAASGVSYEHIAALGGLRGGSRDLGREVNGFWTNTSFHNYADYALSAPFREGFGRLLAIGHERRCAIMCSEAVWWRCHRRIVTDWLLASGEEVFHIMGQGRIDPARLTPGAVIRPDRTVVYPAP